MPRLRIALLALCLLSGSALGNWREALPEARLVGEGELSVFGFRLYSARLWSPVAAFDAGRPFALELIYHREISRERLVEVSIDEIRRLHGDRYDSARLAGWAAQMRRAFVDTAPGSRITGLYLPGSGARFYAGDRLQHEVRDEEFARTFFSIWLDARTRNPELRARLLGTAAP
ncbi:chalcone isomerase family protein [Pseudomonas oryzae]|uniref:Chalcone isomerase-like n=1 Tax=Pseudomonas oryzae TaxID=1392877 RepID=A0A1H1Q504_9PSED|nr:chalcone isomerase family protein [Pseudomonas oryzae]SDS18591.1 Chalcone isomerase-like [Pseudomonas oryzae]